MQRLGGAVIPMRQNSVDSLEPIEYLVGYESTLEAMQSAPVLPIFSNLGMGFLERLAEVLLSDAEARLYPDVATFAFWCRKGSLRKMSEHYAGEKLRLGRGIAFHIAPSNVAVNFAYSFAAALLAGNGSIVRVPSKPFKQVDIICGAIKKILTEMPQMRPYVLMVRYGHDRCRNDIFSSACMTRIIWGGDVTIKEIRKSPLQPRAGEIAFADRYSLAVIDADKYLLVEDKKKIARNFYNDTYLTDQNACTSPKLVVWLGHEQDKARDIFWQNLHELVEQEEYSLQPVQAVDKLMAACLLGAAREDSRLVGGTDNLIIRASICSLDNDVSNYFSHSGFFIEYAAERLEDILPVCGLRCQTVGYYGLEREQIANFLADYRGQGIDRMVPLGRTMDFSLTWDGHDLITEMSRELAWE